MKFAFAAVLLVLTLASGTHATKTFLKGDPSSSFHVLDKINTILEKELNMLTDSQADSGSQVALRGTMENAMSFRGYFPSKKGKLAGFYTAIKGVAMKKAKWVRGKINGHPYIWMAFKVVATVVTAVFCPACVIVVGAAFAAVDIAVNLANLKEASDDLPKQLTGEAKATCLQIAAAKTLLVVVAAGVNVFVPIPLDVAQLAGAATGAIFASIDWGALLGATTEAATGTTAAATDAAMDGMVAGAVGEKVNMAADKQIEEAMKKIKTSNGKIGRCDCKKVADKPDWEGDWELEGDSAAAGATVH